MQVLARKLPDALVHGLALTGLFILVIVLQGAATSAFRAGGMNGGLALALGGMMVLAAVLGVHFQLQRSRISRAGELERARARLGLPDGPCCVVWRSTPANAETRDMPWALDGPIRVAFPKAAQALGVEGMAVVEFEVGANGKAKNFHCVDVWPAESFYAAAVAALSEAEFSLKPGARPRFGASFRMPFVFRIAGAARLRDGGRKALKPRPLLQAAGAAIERLKRRA